MNRANLGQGRGKWSVNPSQDLDHLVEAAATQGDSLCWLAGWLAGWLARWLAGLLVGQLIGWLAGWLAVWPAGWLAGCWVLTGLPIVLARLPACHRVSLGTATMGSRLFE